MGLDESWCKKYSCWTLTLTMKPIQQDALSTSNPQQVFRLSRLTVHLHAARYKNAFAESTTLILIGRRLKRGRYRVHEALSSIASPNVEINTRWRRKCPQKRSAVKNFSFFLSCSFFSIASTLGNSLQSCVAKLAMTCRWGRTAPSSAATWFCASSEQIFR